MKIDYPGDLKKVGKTPRLKISDAKTREDVRAYLEQEGLIIIMSMKALFISQFMTIRLLGFMQLTKKKQIH